MHGDPGGRGDRGEVARAGAGPGERAHLRAGPDGRYWGDGADALAAAPAGMRRAIMAAASEAPARAGLTAEISGLTNGFAGLDDAICKDIGDAEIEAVLACSRTWVHPGEIATHLGEFFGWHIALINMEPEYIERDVTGSEAVRGILAGHGDLVLGIYLDGFGSYVPVFLHGGTIDPRNIRTDFALRVLCADIERRVGRGPAIVLTASVNMCPAPGEAGLASGGAPARLALVPGMAFDGESWAPFALGQRVSSPLARRLDARARCFTEADFTCATRVGDFSYDPLGIGAVLQDMLDRYRVADGAETLPRHFDPHGRAVAYWNESWFCIRNDCDLRR